MSPAVPAAPPGSARRIGLALAGCVALYLLLAGIRAWDHTHPYYDDVGFLDLGNLSGWDQFASLIPRLAQSPE